VRVNRQVATKPAAAVKPGDVLTVALPGGVRVLQVRQPGTRRGPYAEACQLYEELTSKAFPD
jgi:ribosome-associated heat shock protein Hsp15